MTEKRFIMAEPMVTIKDLYFVRDKEQEVYLSISKGIDLLNIQSEYVTKCAKEKEQLIDALNQRTEQCDKLHEENEQLKQDELFITLTERGNNLIDENEKLRQENSRLMMEVAEYSRKIKELEKSVEF